MRIEFHRTGAERKALVTAIGEVLGIKPKYKGMPSAAYEIDYFTVDMDVDECVVSKNSGGVVCTIADKDVKGFISSLEPKYSFPHDVYSKIKPGDILKCKVMEFDFTHRSFQLKYLN